MADLNARDVEHARRMVEGTARSMGLDSRKDRHRMCQSTTKRMKAHDRPRSRRTRTPLPLDQAVDMLKPFNTTKFDQTVEIAIRLGIDPKQADQMVRGSIVLPHGIGKTLRVVVFAKGDKADEAKAAGADEVGGPSWPRRSKTAGPISTSASPRRT